MGIQKGSTYHYFILTICSVSIISGCGSSAQSETPEQKAHREYVTALDKDKSELQNNINETLQTVLEPVGVSIKINLNKMEVVSEQKPLSFENLNYFETTMDLSVKPNTSIQSLKDFVAADLSKMTATIAFDRTQGIKAIAETNFNLLKYVNIRSGGFYSPTKIEQLLLPIQVYDPLKIGSASAYSYDAATNSIKGSKEWPSFSAKMDGSLLADKIVVIAAAKDLRQINSHPLFQAYESIILEQVKNFDRQKMQDSIREFLSQLSASK
ncbi:MAG: hypothetical protein J0L93_06570 [Deltaproteobacteria bacterium]|nr:hypothetical protein [Deltaproteobacteria bacterium]